MHQNHDTNGLGTLTSMIGVYLLWMGSHASEFAGFVAICFGIAIQFKTYQLRKREHQLKLDEHNEARRRSPA